MHHQTMRPDGAAARASQLVGPLPPCSTTLAEASEKGILGSQPLLLQPGLQCPSESLSHLSETHQKTPFCLSQRSDPLF